ncbi:hypothetical protein INT43_001859 [Umbelopsis isabellina]|uniref:TM7S3/TM198-like domain-containing protein n=1 Tax=Mortierella isabellina TaxID=91625 RepID=A0A8H7PSK8_MORIS|nr:hypothetical protein INT43_001859 [Umbelopsis isabellina]
MRYSWFLILLSTFALQISLSRASPQANVNNWTPNPCNDNTNNNNKRGIVISPGASLEPLVGNWATSTTTSTPTHTTSTTTTTATATQDNCPSPTPTSPPAQCSSQNTSSWSWSDYLYHTYGYGVTPALGVMGGMLMLIGLHFMTFGFRVFRGTLALVGFTVFGIVTWIGLTNGEPAGGYPHRDIIYVTVIIGLGLLGAIVFMYFWCFSIYMIGGTYLTGSCFLEFNGLSLCDLRAIMETRPFDYQSDHHSSTQNIARICFIIGLVFLFAGSIYIAERYVILFSLSFSGAYLFILGLDLFIHTGFINAPRSILDHNGCHSITYRITTGVYVMLAMVIVLTLLAFCWQYYWNVMIMNRCFGVNVVAVKPETVVVAESAHSPSAGATVVAISEKPGTSHHSEVVPVVSEKPLTSHHSEVIVSPVHSAHSHHSVPLSVIRENASAIASGTGPLSKSASHHTTALVSGPRSVVESVAPSSHHTVISPSRKSLPASAVSASRHSATVVSGGHSGSKYSAAPTGTRSARGRSLPVPSILGSLLGEIVPVGSVHTGTKSAPASSHHSASHHSASQHSASHQSASRHSTSHHSASHHSPSHHSASHHSPSHHSGSQHTESHHTGRDLLAAAAAAAVAAAASRRSVAPSVLSGNRSLSHTHPTTAQSVSGNRSIGTGVVDDDDSRSTSTSATMRSEQPPPVRKLFGIIPVVY